MSTGINTVRPQEDLRVAGAEENNGFANPALPDLIIPRVPEADHACRCADRPRSRRARRPARPGPGSRALAAEAHAEGTAEAAGCVLEDNLDAELQPARRRRVDGVVRVRAGRG